MTFECCTDSRRAAIEGSSINGINYLEVLDSEAPSGVPPQQVLVVHCVNPLGPVAPTINSACVTISGGESIQNIQVVSAMAASLVTSSSLPPTMGLMAAYCSALKDVDNCIVVLTDRSGDFSTYVLSLVQPGASSLFPIMQVLKGFDVQLASVSFSFKVECPPYFDCLPVPPDCPPDSLTLPPINYLAKDFGSFKTVMTDRLNQLLPNWGATSEADLGIALVELVSYVGDHLSYWQDAIGTEAYIQTARRRVSLRRHAKLVDYPVSDGVNARAWIQLTINAPNGTPVFMNGRTQRFYTSAPGMPSPLNPGSGNEEAALAVGVVAFEPMQSAVLYADHNLLKFYTWMESLCCLPEGATSATLQQQLNFLQQGDVLIFQEVKGPQTGDPADADIRHRCAVRLTAVQTASDALNGNFPITEIQWAADDALPFPVCISSQFIDENGKQQTVSDVSVVFGNIVLADQGMSLSGVPIGTVCPPSLTLPPNPSGDRCSATRPASIPSRFYPMVPDSPVTQAVPITYSPLTQYDPVTHSSQVDVPVAPQSVPLSVAAVTGLVDASGFPCLVVQTDQLGLWPSYFGFLLTPNGSGFDLAIVYNPPAGPPGGSNWIAIETISKLSIDPSPPAGFTYVGALVSPLVTVPASYTPPAVPASSFPLVPTMFSGQSAVSLPDPADLSVPYVTLQPTNPVTWAALFSASIPSATATTFDLEVVYTPSTTTVEIFSNVSLGNVESAVNGVSNLIVVDDFAELPDLTQSATELMTYLPSAAVPVITLFGQIDGETSVWQPEYDLLESGPEVDAFVVEVETTGQANLRFGDNTNGKMPDSGTAFTANYRIGNGTAGNVGVESLTNLATDNPEISDCTDPMPATGGVDPETSDQIRRRAPQAFFTQERAITMADYEKWTDVNPQVDQAVSEMRWTGSWYTVFTAVEPVGGGVLSTALAQSLDTEVEPYRLAGQDLVFDSPQYVSLYIVLNVCVDPSYFNSDVQQALYQVLGSQALPNGQFGYFYADNFTFGQTVYLSPIYLAARSVPGVISVTAQSFQPMGPPTSQYLSSGEIPMGTLQVARLANNPSFPGWGQLIVNVAGGK